MFVPNSVKFRSRGTSGQTGEIELFVCDFFIYFFIFFSDQRREETPGRILTRNGSNDAETSKDVPFDGVIKWKIEMTPIYPQNPKNLALNRQFPANVMKHETPSISESTEPIEMKIQYNVRNIVSSIRMQYDDVTANPIWRTAAILKIVLSLAYISAGNHPISTKFGM